MARTFQRSPLALAVLILLYEAPMHPYRMQQLIKERGKDKVINVQRRGSLYQTINQLQRAGLITVRETSRDEKFPERTVYALTDKGFQTARDWMRQILSTPGQEFPEFPAAVSFLPVLTPEDALYQLEQRESALVDRITDIKTDIESSTIFLPRLFLLEEEYLQVVLEAELNWVRSIIGDLRAGRLTWNEEMMRNYLPPESK